MWQFFRQCGNAFHVIGRRFIEDRLTYAASALTYTTLLALVPLMAVFLSVFSAFPVFQSVSKEVQAFIFQNFIPASGQIIQQHLHQFSQQAGKLSVIGTMVLIVTAVMMMLTVERALNDIWKIYRRRQGLSALLRYWAVLSLAPIFIGISITATSYIVSLPLIVGTAKTLGLTNVLLKSVPIVLTIIAFMLLYIVVPNCQVPTRHAFLGAVIATILFEFAKKGFVIYITKFSAYHFIYGAAAVIPVFLIWIYCLWVIILFGALISNIFATQAFNGSREEIDGFTHAFLWLGYLWKAQQEGKKLSLRQLHQLLPGHYRVASGVLIYQLEKKHLVERTFRHRYVLTRDFSEMTLADLYDCLPWKFPIHFDRKLIIGKAETVFQHANQTLREATSLALKDIYEDFL